MRYRWLLGLLVLCALLTGCGFPTIGPGNDGQDDPGGFIQDSAVEPPSATCILAEATYYKPEYMVWCPLIHGISSKTQDVIGYNLYRSSAPDGPFTFLNVAFVNVNEWAASDTTLEPNRSYYYRLSAVTKAKHESPLSETYTFTSVPTVKLLSPKNTVISANTGFTFEFEPRSDFFIYNINVEKKDPSGNWTWVWWSNDQATSPCLGAPLAPGEYRWWIRAYKVPDMRSLVAAMADYAYFTVK